METKLLKIAEIARQKPKEKIISILRRGYNNQEGILDRITGIREREELLQQEVNNLKKDPRL